MGEVSLKSKTMYKATLAVLKILPMVMAFSYLMMTLCAHLQVPWQLPFHYLGIVIAPLAFMYLASYVFRFCNYHRVFIHYIAFVELLNITDYYYRIPISNEAICTVHYGVTAVFLLTALYLYIKKYKKDKCCIK
jgi:hypothetical protein